MTLQSDPKRSFGFALLLIFVLAAVVRLAYLGQFSASPIFQVFQIDARWYAQQAVQIADGQLTEGRCFYRAPLYPFFLGALCRLTNDDFGIVRVVQHLLGVLACVLVSLIAGECFDRRSALLGGVIAAVYGPLIHFESQLMATTLGVALFLCVLYALLRTAKRPTGLRRFGCGVGLGLCAITRPNFLVLLPVIALGWGMLYGKGQRRRRRVADVLCLTCGTCLSVLPVTLHNIIAAGQGVLIASQGGVQFYIGNNPAADGKTGLAPVDYEEDSPFFTDNIRIGSMLAAEQATGRQLSDSEVSRYWYARGFAFWRDTPLAAPALAAKKTYYFLNGFEIESIHSVYLDALWSPIAGVLTWHRIVAFPLGLIWPLAIVGLLLRSSQTPVTWILRWCAVGYALSIIAFLVSGRLRMPIVPLLIIFAAAAIVHLVDVIRRGQLRRACGLLVLLGALGWLSNSTFAQVRGINHAWQFGLVASAHLELGELDEALDMFNRALQAEPDNFFCLYNLGATLQLSGNTPAALDQLNRALDVAPGSAKTHNTLGVVLSSQGRVSDAIDSFRQAVTHAPQWKVPHMNLGHALLLGGSTRQAIESLRRALEIDPDYGDAHYNLAASLAEAGDYQAAAGHLQRARELGIEADPGFVRDLRQRLETP